MGIRTRLIAAAMAVATVTALAGAAVASAAPASPSSSAASGDKKGGDDKDAVVAKVAASLHVTVDQLVTALGHLKQAIGGGADKAAAVAAFAKELNVSVVDAEKALQALSSSGGKEKAKPGKDKGVPEEAITLLAGELHISAKQARQVFQDMDKVKANGEDVVKDPAFIAIAKGLGITPQRLLDALKTVKQEIAAKEGKGKPKEKAPSGTPSK